MAEKTTYKGVDVDKLEMPDLQQICKDNGLPWIGITKPSLAGKVKIFLRENPDKAGTPVNENPTEVQTDLTNEADKSSEQSENQPKEKTVMAKAKPKKAAAKKAAPKKKAAAKKATAKKSGTAKGKAPAKKAAAKNPKAANESGVKRGKFTTAEVKALREKPEVAKILKMEIKGHMKIWKLHKLDYSQKEIAAIMTDSCNMGYIWNNLNKYKENPAMQKAAIEA